MIGCLVTRASSAQSVSTGSLDFEFGGWQVAEGLVQSGLVEPADVFNRGVGRPMEPDAVCGDTWNRWSTSPAHGCLSPVAAAAARTAQRVVPRSFRAGRSRPCACAGLTDGPGVTGLRRRVRGPPTYQTVTPGPGSGPHERYNSSVPGIPLQAAPSPANGRTVAHRSPGTRPAAGSSCMQTLPGPTRSVSRCWPARARSHHSAGVAGVRPADVPARFRCGRTIARKAQADRPAGVQRGPLSTTRPLSGSWPPTGRSP